MGCIHKARAHIEKRNKIIYIFFKLFYFPHIGPHFLNLYLFLLLVHHTLLMFALSFFYIHAHFSYICTLSFICMRHLPICTLFVLASLRATTEYNRSSKTLAFHNAIYTRLFLYAFHFTFMSFRASIRLRLEFQILGFQ